MSVEYLGPDFDIHGGGLDLVFPHHENEIAQSLCGDPDHGFARFWVHNGHLSSEGEKMSKSLGNFYLVSDLLDEFPGEALRLALLKTHYRQPMDFTKAGLAEAKADLDGFYATLHAFAEVEPQEAAADTVLSALADDLNTPAALVRLHEVRSALNALDPAAANAEVAKLKGQLLSGGILLGLLQADPAEWRRGTKSAAGTDDDSLDPAAIEEHIAQRIAARAAKNFAEADRIRDSLAKNGIVLEDLPDGSTDWRREG
jgi:cysteinyl-tRNA synthetase